MLIGKYVSLDGIVFPKNPLNVAFVLIPPILSKVLILISLSPVNDAHCTSLLGTLPYKLLIVYLGGNEITFLFKSSVYLIVKFDVSAVGIVLSAILNDLSVPANTSAVVPFRLAVSTLPV